MSLNLGEKTHLLTLKPFIFSCLSEPFSLLPFSLRTLNHFRNRHSNRPSNSMQIYNKHHKERQGPISESNNNPELLKTWGFSFNKASSA